MSNPRNVKGEKKNIPGSVPLSGSTPQVNEDQDPSSIHVWAKSVQYFLFLFYFVILLTEQPADFFEYITSLVDMIIYILSHHPPTPRKAFCKVQLPPYIVNPSRLMESPELMLWSSICRCSHFKQALKPCYMYDARWVCSKVFRFIIKWMKRYLCESKLIQMCSGVSWHLCLSIHTSKFDLVGF